MPVKTFKLETIADAVAIATTLTCSWFRGHTRAVGELIPRVYRREFDNEIQRAFRPTPELGFIERFQRDSPTMASVDLPDKTDQLGWLAVMQHYQTPTRLLDWTESPLVALYFAVRDEPKQDAELWAMLPWALNMEAGIGWGLPILANAPALRYLVHEPYWAGTAEALAKKEGLDAPQQRPLAVLLRRTFARMVAQRSAFTIHPRPLDGHAITAILSDAKHLVRYLVPAARKVDLLAALDRLGINHQSVMPDLEGLSKQIVYESRIIGYSPPDPPQASGSVETADVQPAA